MALVTTRRELLDEVRAKIAAADQELSGPACQ
jgi:hypothetical protein